MVSLVSDRTASGRLRAQELGLGVVEEQGPHLLPELATEDEEAAKEDQVADRAIGKPILNVAGYAVGDVRAEPAEDQRGREHDEAEAVPRSAHLAGRSESPQEAEQLSPDVVEAGPAQKGDRGQAEQLRYPNDERPGEGRLRGCGHA